MSAQAHTSDPSILDRRTLARDHRRLAALLRPGMRVLDVGCGTGAITAGIARAVAWGDVGFDDALAIWQRVIATMGPPIVEAGVLAARDVDAAATAYAEWCRRSAHRQHMVLRAVVARNPTGGSS